MPAIVPVKNQENNKLRLLYLSRIHPKKKLHVLLKALPFVDGEWQLTVAGDGDPQYLTQLKQIALNQNIDDKINWVGFKGNEKFDLMANHDMLILPSEDENFANVVIESLSVGTAVVITKTVGLASYVSKNMFGAICDMDQFSLSDKINQLAAQPQKLASIAQNAPGIIRRDFDDHQLTGHYIKMYSKIIN